MTLTIAVVAALAVVVGVALGLLGGGGSIMMVPLLVYAAGVETKTAIAMSLFVVGITSLVGMVSHARAGRVRWRTGLSFGLAGMAGAYVGGLVGGHLPGQLLLVAFAGMMLAASVAMLRGRRGGGGGERTSIPVVRVVVQGAAVGFVAGTVGAGGGFLIVPALVLLAGLPMAPAVGTSLVVLTMQSLAGFLGYLSVVSLDWTLTATVSSLAVVGSLLGSRVAGLVPEQRLRRAFGWFVLVLGAFMLTMQAPVEYRLPVAVLLAVVAGALGVCWNFVRSCPVRRVVAA